MNSCIKNLYPACCTALKHVSLLLPVINIQTPGFEAAVIMVFWAASITVLVWCCLQATSSHLLVRLITLGKRTTSHTYTGFKLDPPDDSIQRVCIIQCWAMHVCSLLFSLYSYPRRGKNSVCKPKTTVFFILNLGDSKYCFEKRQLTSLNKKPVHNLS